MHLESDRDKEMKVSIFTEGLSGLPVTLGPYEGKATWPNLLIKNAPCPEENYKHSCWSGTMRSEARTAWRKVTENHLSELTSFQKSNREPPQES